jgi:hypothetical protein
MFQKAELIATERSLSQSKLNETCLIALDRRVVMAQVIEFYVPAKFHKKVKWVPPDQRGRMIEFPAEIKKSA